MNFYLKVRDCVCLNVCYDEFLFKGKRLCVSKCLLRELLVREAYEGGLMGHFGAAKSLDMLHKHFYWPYLKMDAQRIYDRYITCKKTKSRVKPHGLYTYF